jgi:hypothetical protein
MNSVKDAVEALQRAREAKLEELKAINQALESLRGVAETEEEGGKRQTPPEFEHLGITAAAKVFLARENGPRTTREIIDALEAGGIQSTAKKFVATVYATLKNSKDIVRTLDGKWELVQRST